MMNSKKGRGRFFFVFFLQIYVIQNQSIHAGITNRLVENEFGGLSALWLGLSIGFVH